MKKLAKSKALLFGALLAILALPALAWPPGGNGGGNGNGGGGDGGSTAPQFQWVSLGTLHGGDHEQTVMFGMNNKSEVVGSSRDDVGGVTDRRAFLNVANTDGSRQMIDLHDKAVAEGLIPSFDYGTYTGMKLTEAHDINDSGQIVGEMTLYFGPGDQEIVGFYYAPATQTSQAFLTLFPLGGEISAGYNILKINNLGTCVGHTYDEVVGRWEVFTWNPDSGYGYLSDNNSSLFARDINDQGQITGTAGRTGWIYTPGSGYEDIDDKKGEPLPYAINDNGEVVGYVFKRRFSTYQAFRYKNGSLTTFSNKTLELLRDVNNAGEAVGRGIDGTPRLNGAGYGTIDLMDTITGAPATRSITPISINNAGNIAGNFRDIEIYEEPFLLIRTN